MSGQGQLVVIVEDEFTRSSALSENLKKEGVNITSLERGPDLVKNLASMSPEIVITDLDADNPADPFATISAMKKTEALKDTEIFAYVSGIDVKMEVALRKLKITSYFTKSRDAAPLAKGIRNHFSWDEISKEYDPWGKDAPEKTGDDNSKYLDDVTLPREEFPEEPQEDAPSPQPRHFEHAPPSAQPADARHEEVIKPQPTSATTPEPGPPVETAIPEQAAIDEPVAQVSRTVEPAKKHEDANEFLDMLSEVQEGMEKKLESMEATADEHYKRGVALLQSGDSDQALKQFMASVLAEEWKATSLAKIGEIHKKSGRYGKAAEAFKEGFKASTDDASRLEFRYEIADTLFRAGKLPEAYKMFAVVYKTDKTYKETRARLVEIKTALESGRTA